MNRSFEFWDALAPHHSAIENSYLDLRSLRHIINRIQPPVLVVGAGQGLIVEQLKKEGFPCDGVDLSSEMVRFAKHRRGLDLVQANAKAMPFGNGTYQTILYATGVVDFMTDEGEIRVILDEGRRIAGRSGIILVAFYRISAATEALLVRLGLLKNTVLRHRDTLEIYRFTPVQAIAWAAKRAGVGYARAAMLLLGSWACSTWQEKRNALHLQRIFARANHGEALIQAAHEQQGCRNETEIRDLFRRLAIPIKQFDTCASCYVAQI